MVKPSLVSSAFVARVAVLGPRLLIVEPTEGNGAADALALDALRAGIDNVLVLCAPSARGFRNHWLDVLLEHIRAGLWLRPAVVELRKRMQRALIEARRAEIEQPHAPARWHALRHYSARPVACSRSCVRSLRRAERSCRPCAAEV